MSKEEMQKVREADKLFHQVMKQGAKQFGYSKISNHYYQKREDFFLYIIIYPTKIVNDKYQISAHCFIKAYSHDDLFWKIFQMESNIKAKQSIRVNGAFAIPGYPLEIARLPFCIPIDEQKVHRLLEQIEMIYDGFLSTISWDLKNYDEYIIQAEKFYRSEITKLLARIQLDQIQQVRDEAKQRISNNETGGYINKGKSAYQWILEYVDRQL